MVSKRTQFAILLNQIHLGEDVDMRKLHMKHGGQGGAEHRDELGRISTVMRVHQMHRRQLKEERNMWGGETGMKAARTCARIKSVVYVSEAHPEIPLGQLGKNILY